MFFGVFFSFMICTRSMRLRFFFFSLYVGNSYGKKNYNMDSSISIMRLYSVHGLESMFDTFLKWELAYKPPSRRSRCTLQYNTEYKSRYIKREKNISFFGQQMVYFVVVIVVVFVLKFAENDIQYGMNVDVVYVLYFYASKHHLLTFTHTEIRCVELISDARQ